VNNWSLLTFGANDGAINLGDIRFGRLGVAELPELVAQQCAGEVVAGHRRK
jgi:hypothetical protein